MSALGAFTLDLTVAVMTIGLLAPPWRVAQPAAGDPNAATVVGVVAAGLLCILIGP